MNFETIVLEDALARLIDYRGKTPRKTDSGVRLITAKVIKGGRITDDRFEYIADDEYDTWMRRGLPETGDMLVTTEAPLGEVAELRTEDRVALAQRVILLRADRSKMHQRFMFHAFRSPFVQAGLARRSTGTTVKGIKQSELRQIELPCPPLPTQRRIAGILSGYDDLIENNTKRIKILEEMARALYREWFVHFRFPGHEKVKLVDSPLGQIPERWEVVEVSGITSMVKRGVAPRYVEEGGELVINQKCIRDDQLTLDRARRHVKEVPSERYVQVGDVLINSTGVGTLGRAAQVLVELQKTTVDTHVTIVRPSEAVRSTYFGMMCLSMQPVFDAMGAGSTNQTELSRTRVAALQVQLPPDSLQERFAALVDPWRDLTQVLLSENGVLREARDLLLPRLISGEIDVDALDLPEVA